MNYDTKKKKKKKIKSDFFDSSKIIFQIFLQKKNWDGEA